MKFIPTFKESSTEIYNKCSYCGKYIIHRKTDRNITSYRINGEWICWDCLVNLAYKLGISISELRKVSLESINKDFWLCTPDSTSLGHGVDSVRCVYSGGCIGCDWCYCAKGVRPFFILKS